MKNPMQKLRRFFVRSRTYKATAAPSATATSHDDDDGANRLSGAFIVVLFLHIIAVVGVFAFARIKESRLRNAPPEKSAPTAMKPAAAKPSVAKAALAKAPAPAPAAMLATVTPPQAAPHESAKTAPVASHTVHMVKDGETLKKIAFAYSASVPEFVSLNKLKNADDIRPGQSLTIPVQKPAPKLSAATEVKSAATGTLRSAPAAGKTYTVRKGDSPLKIARELGCSYDELMKVNNVRDPKKIQVGQELKIPAKKG